MNLFHFYFIIILFILSLISSVVKECNTDEAFSALPTTMKAKQLTVELPRIVVCQHAFHLSILH